jgi:hypothetical protein
MVHVPAAPPLVAGVVVWVVAGAGVCDHNHQRGVFAVAHVLALQPLAIAVCKVHRFASDLFAFATAATEIKGLVPAAKRQGCMRLRYACSRLALVAQYCVEAGVLGNLGSFGTSAGT